MIYKFEGLDVKYGFRFILRRFFYVGLLLEVRWIGMKSTREDGGAALGRRLLLEGWSEKKV